MFGHSYSLIYFLQKENYEQEWTYLFQKENLKKRSIIRYVFFRQRFGDELVENLIDPLLSGIYSGDMDEMSLMATFPNFYQLEQEYGSLIKGLQKTMPKPKKTKEKKQGIFFSLKKMGWNHLLTS